MDYGERLKSALKSAGMSQAELARQAGISQQSVQYLCAGKGRGSIHSDKFANILGVNTRWLSSGEGPREPDNIAPGPEIQGRVPLISWVQAGEFCEAIDLFQPGDADDWIPCPTQHSDSSFALKVQGASMEPKFTEGELIIVDPMKSPNSGSYVIAQKTGDKSVTFKQLMTDGGQHYLKALNPEWPNRIIKMDEEWHICGVIICKLEMF